MPVYVKLVLVKRTEKVRSIRLFLGTIICLGMAKAAYIHRMSTPPKSDSCLQDTYKRKVEWQLRDLKVLDGLAADSAEMRCTP